MKNANVEKKSDSIALTFYDPVERERFVKKFGKSTSSKKFDKWLDEFLSKK